MNDERRRRRSREWLWDTLRVDQPDGGRAPDDPTLESYRAARLEPAESTRVEWHLSRSRAGRLRLAELAGVAPAAPSPRVRASVLGLEVPDPRARRFPLLAMAAVAALLLLAVWIGGPGRTPDQLPAGLSFDVRVEGLAEVRGAEGLDRAHADTPVRILAEPRGVAVEGLQFRLYGRKGAGLVRLDDGAAVRVNAHRGAAEIVAGSASDLGGPEPGERELFLVVSREGDYAEEVAIASGMDAATVLENLSSGQVYRRTFKIVPVEEGLQ